MLSHLVTHGAVTHRFVELVYRRGRDLPEFDLAIDVEVEYIFFDVTLAIHFRDRDSSRVQQGGKHVAVYRLCIRDYAEGAAGLSNS